MSNQRVQMVGSSCGQHGSYTFYKAFSFGCGSGGRRRVLALGEFFFARLWPAAAEHVAVAELLAVFDDSGCDERLACLRLYFLPEHTPDGRLDCHGEDEILAVEERLTVRLEELVDVVVRPPRWTAGWYAGAAHDPSAPPATFCSSGVAAASGRLRLADVDRAKREMGDTVAAEEPCALILSYDQYCRARGVMKRLESVSPQVYRHALVRALGGLQIPSRNTRLLYCRDQFEYPELDCHEIFCNHLAPKMKGRTKKKARSEDSPPSSESTSDTDNGLPYRLAPAQVRLPVGAAGRGPGRPTLMRGLTPNPKPLYQLKSYRWGEKEFLQRLGQVLRQGGHTPNLGRLPNLGLQNVNLYQFYRRVQELGGYQSVCSVRLWKRIYQELGGNPQNATGVTHCRRLFERLLLPFERYDRGQTLPLPPRADPGHILDGAPPALTRRPQQRRTYSSAEAARRPATSALGAAMLSALAESRPSITITPLPPSAPAQAVPSEPSSPDIEVIDLTSGEEGAPAAPLLKPTRIGSITITPVGKAAPAAAAAPLSSVEQLMALHMASTSLPPQMLQYMAGLPAGGGGGGGGKTAGLEQLQRAQQQVALQSLMAQRMSMMPSMPGMSREQAQANVEAYRRMLQSNFNKS
ncbi:AT-rich interactive domain-containing protein 5B [Amphibalanus amphitrite]|uniref:AT-rich interactive domain-containing protein 5B n=1 Tax=Amphibalanus amphitrite TaxID=1232801 RepID=A0A6A4VU51_AMPAM|nr:AT-rich interactive domain-containing protein 5B [Amphibalanus amphitrite]